MRSHVYSTYPVGKISMKFKANRFFIFKLRNSFANYFSNCYEIITADLLVPALYPHTGVDVSDNLFSDAVWDVFSVLKYRWRWKEKLSHCTLKILKLEVLGCQLQTQSCYHFGIRDQTRVTMLMVTESALFSGRSNCKVW